MIWDIIEFFGFVVLAVILLEVVLHWISWRLRVIQRNMRRRERERHARALRKAHEAQVRLMNASTRPIPRVLTEEEEYFAYRAHA